MSASHPINVHAVVSYLSQPQRPSALDTSLDKENDAYRCLKWSWEPPSTTKPKAGSVRMTVAEYIGVLRRNLIMIIALVLAVGVGSFLYAHTLPRLYRSHASVIVIPERGESTSEIVQGSNYVQNIVQSYALLATSPYVLQPVIDKLGLNETPGQLAQRMSVETPLNTVAIQVSVTDESPQRAQETAAAITDSLIRAVSKLSPKIGNNPAVHLQTISPASLPQTFVSPDYRLYLLGGAAAGLALALAIAFLREQLRSRPRNTEDLRSITDLPVLGQIPRLARGATTLPGTVLDAPDGQIAEALRAIAASLRFVSVDKAAKVIIVTSARPSDGKSSVATALGLTLAEAGKKILVIDADLRNPSVADMLEIEGSIGLTTTLLHDCSFAEAIQPWGHRNLRIMAAGTRSPNPGQLISSGQLTDVISEARAAFDTVLIDTSPVLPVSDALWLAPLTDGVIVVAKARHTPIRAIDAAIEAIETTRAGVLGVILNATKVGAESRYHGVNYGIYGQQAKARRRAFKLPTLW